MFNKKSLFTIQKNDISDFALSYIGNKTKENSYGCKKIIKIRA